MDRPSAIPRPRSRLPLPAASFGRSLRSSPSRERLNADTGLDARRLHRPSQESLRRWSPLIGLAERIESESAVCDEFEQSSNGGWITDARSGGFPLDENESSDQRASYCSDRSTFDLPYRSSPNTRSSRSTSRSSLYSRSASIHDPSIDSPGLSNLNRLPTTSPGSPASLNPNRLSVSQGQPPSSSSSPSSKTRKPVPPSPQPPNVNQKRFTMSALPPKSPKVNRSSGVATTAGPRMHRPLGLSSSRKSSLTTIGANYDDDYHDEASHPATEPPAIPSHPRTAPRKPGSAPKKQLANSTPKRRAVSKPRPVSCVAAVSPAAAIDEPEKVVKTVQKPAKSSAALRESIAKAKAAARQAARASQSHVATVDIPSQPLQSFDNGGFVSAIAEDLIDPFNQGPKGAEAQKMVLKRKAKQGRTTGVLNIAALGLTEIPEEIMRMYEFNPEETSGGEWAESVDLVKLVAADNEFESLADAAFPDVDPMAVLENDDVEGNFQFLGLEMIDLHGNRLSQLPTGFRRLERLRSLNLSKNNLPMDIFDLIAQIPNLAELRMAGNRLSGTLSPSVGDLRQLELLDLRENNLTVLCDEITSLTSLTLLDVSDNNLTTLPSAIFTNVPLLELNAKGNRLNGDLIPSSVTSIPRLQTLTVTGNSLTGLSACGDLSLPSLEQLHIGGNRITTLPDMSTWVQLLTLVAEENHLSQLPDGFTKLPRVKVADFTGNDIRNIPAEIGLMDSLSTLKLANNPLAEKRFLSMDTEQMLLAMRAKLEPAPKDEDSDNSSVQTYFTLPEESPSTQAPRTAPQLKTGGVLDLSGQDLDELAIARIEDMARTADVRTVRLARASLQVLPIPVLAAAAHSMVELDLSHNMLKSHEISTSMLYLPCLRTLTLTHANLTCVEDLLTKLSAPCLQKLDLSHNRLTGKLPMFREIFPCLLELNVAENKFDSIDYESVRGLRTLDISNNAIGYLPPRIKLLAGDGGLKSFLATGNMFHVPNWLMELRE